MPLTVTEQLRDALQRMQFLQADAQRIHDTVVEQGWRSEEQDAEMEMMQSLADEISAEVEKLTAFAYNFGAVIPDSGCIDKSESDLTVASILAAGCLDCVFDPRYRIELNVDVGVAIVYTCRSCGQPVHRQHGLWLHINKADFVKCGKAGIPRSAYGEI
jgi:hypothetical protein